MYLQQGHRLIVIFGHLNSGSERVKVELFKGRPEKEVQDKSIKLKTKDIIDIYLKAVHHAPIFVKL